MSVKREFLERFPFSPIRNPNAADGPRSGPMNEDGFRAARSFYCALNGSCRVQPGNLISRSTLALRGFLELSKSFECFGLRW
jgi:hypothetical protein